MCSRKFSLNKTGLAEQRIQTSLSSEIAQVTSQILIHFKIMLGCLQSHGAKERNFMDILDTFHYFTSKVSLNTVDNNASDVCSVTITCFSVTWPLFIC